MVLIVMFGTLLQVHSEITKLSFWTVCIFDEIFVLNMLKELSGMLSPVPKNLR